MSTAPLIRTLQDIQQIESTPLSERDLPSSTFELIRRTAQASPDLCETIRQTLAAETKLPVPWIEVRSLDALTLKQNGLIDYQALQKTCE